ncbi:hypothetical protein GIB67_039780 [Kingdonia uniflora]|uniref:Dynamin GTPase effector domain-containing protein n=1 Tax=Kingdonia uniflora TaxID=39325 RepID=A0A7J7MQ11_9MAGN|nr:hypothetical protein GIB67_039780 [Kingdonia uniflora]
MRDESKKATLKLVDIESSYLTVDFFRKLPQDVEKGGNPTHSIFDRYNDSFSGDWQVSVVLIDSALTILRLASLLSFSETTGSTVLAYVNMVCRSLQNSIPNSIVYCQVCEAKGSLLDHFFAEMGKKEAKHARDKQRSVHEWPNIP